MTAKQAKCYHCSHKNTARTRKALCCYWPVMFLKATGSKVRKQDLWTSIKHKVFITVLLSTLLTHFPSVLSWEVSVGTPHSASVRRDAWTSEVWDWVVLLRLLNDWLKWDVGEKMLGAVFLVLGRTKTFNKKIIIIIVVKTYDKGRRGVRGIFIN